MNWFNKKPKVEFYSVSPAETFGYPIEKMSTVDKPWIKESALFSKQKKTELLDLHVGAGHGCSGINQLMTTGYVLRALNDFVIKTNGDGETFTWQTPSAQHPPIKYFPPEQYGDYAPLPPNTLKTVIKVTTPWRVKVPAGYKILLLPIVYGEKQAFTACPGVLDTSISCQINPILFWHELNGETLVKAGTPLCQLILIKDESAELVVREASDDEYKYDSFHQAYAGNSFSSKPPNVFQKFKEAYEAPKKKCPFSK
jgi:hypothetical protein